MDTFMVFLIDGVALRFFAAGDDLCFRVMDAFFVSVDARLRHVSLSSDTMHCRNCSS
jgi:hypothetical protein